MMSPWRSARSGNWRADPFVKSREPSHIIMCARIGTNRGKNCKLRCKPDRPGLLLFFVDGRRRRPQALDVRCGFLLAGELGFEPRLAESESAVLPLNYSPVGTDIGVRAVPRCYLASTTGPRKRIPRPSPAGRCHGLAQQSTCCGAQPGNRATRARYRPDPGWRNAME